MTSQRLKILHVGNHTIPCTGGVENVIWDSARTQAKLGHDVTIMVFDSCTRSESGAKLRASEEIEGVRIIRVPEFKIGFYRVPPLGVFLDAARHHDIIHVHGFGGWLDLACISKPLHGKPIIVNTHGLFFHTSNRKWFKKIYSNLLMPFIKYATNYFCADSQQDYLRLLPLSKDKGSVIPNGVNIEPFLRVTTAKKEMTHFIFVGRLSQNKRIDLLLDAFAVVQKNSPKATLSIVGEDWERLLPQFEKQSRALKLKNVTFYGRISPQKMLQLYSSAGVCVSASSYEGFGVSIIEGMAAGCIPCVSRIPTFTEFVGENRGILVDFTDSAPAGKAIVALLERPVRESNSTRSRARTYANEFGLERIAREHIRVYHSIISATTEGKT